MCTAGSTRTRVVGATGFESGRDRREESPRVVNDGAVGPAQAARDDARPRGTAESVESAIVDALRAAIAAGRRSLAARLACELASALDEESRVPASNVVRLGD